MTCYYLYAAKPVLTVKYSNYIFGATTLALSLSIKKINFNKQILKICLW